MAELGALMAMGMIGHRMIKQVSQSEQYDAKVDKIYEEDRTTIGLADRKRNAGDPIPYGGATGRWFPDYTYVNVDGNKIKYTQYGAGEGNYNRVATKPKEVRAFTGRGNIRIGLSAGEFMSDTTPGLNAKTAYGAQKAARAPYYVQATY